MYYHKKSTAFSVPIAMKLKNFEHQYRGADKSLARPGRKNLQRPNSNFWKPLKKIQKVSVQPGLRGSKDFRVGQKMATFKLFFQSDWAKDLSVPLYIYIDFIHRISPDSNNSHAKYA
jgi:hypothetical protein